MEYETDSLTHTYTIAFDVVYGPDFYTDPVVSIEYAFRTDDQGVEEDVDEAELWRVFDRAALTEELVDADTDNQVHQAEQYRNGD